ncbi:MAG: hypothetical protein ACLGHL_05520 [Actinomycetota bacterium]
MRNRSGLVVGLVVVAVVAAGLTVTYRSRVGTTDPIPAPRGLRAGLLDSSTDESWTTKWRLCWDPVDHADRYLVTVATAEGAGSAIEVEGTCYELTIASGALNDGMAGRDAQLSLMSSQMTVAVRAQVGDRVGPETDYVAVGEEL